MLLASALSFGSAVSQLWNLLSSVFFDWFVTSDNAVAALRLLEALPAEQRDVAFDALGPKKRRILWGKLNDRDRTRADQLWSEKQERIFDRQRALMEPVVSHEGPKSDVAKKQQEYSDYIRLAGNVDEDVAIAYYSYVEHNQQDQTYLAQSPADLFRRISSDVAERRQSSDAAERKRKEGARSAAEREGLASKRFIEFEDFFQKKLSEIDNQNTAKAEAQEETLRRLNHWMAEHYGQPDFVHSQPARVYKDLESGVVTPAVARRLERAERAPQDDASRQKTLDKFLQVAQRLRAYTQRFPYLIPVPSEGRDLLVTGDPGQEKVYKDLAGDVGGWALKHYWDSDFTTSTPTSVLDAYVTVRQDQIKAAALKPLVFESIERTDIDPETVVKSFASTLGKVLIVAAIVGFVVAAELLTAGQVTWLLVAAGAAMGTKAYLDRRDEIEKTGVDVPRAETIVHSAGDVIGLSQMIEGVTGLRLGTERRLGTMQRSEELGEGAADITGILIGSRAFKAGGELGQGWRASAPRSGEVSIKAAAEATPKDVTPANVAPPVAPPTDVGLPGPAEDFPFGSGARPLPAPGAPNKIYRIMSLSEAAETLRTGKLQGGTTAGTQPNKYLSLDSDYAILFKENPLDKANNLGRQAAQKSAKAATLPADSADVVRLRAEADALTAEAKQLVSGWNAAEGQRVVVEFDLEPGALEHMLKHACDEGIYKSYEGKDVYIYKFERGYGRNIAVPGWQVDNFNDVVVGARLYGAKSLDPAAPIDSKTQN
ncbi:MAG TPA: hypothetical protein VGI19_13495 [Candidatus Cybelea sp.]